MPYKVEKTVNLDGSPYQGAEVDIVALDGSQSLGRTTTDVNGLFSVNVGEYSNEVFASVYINGIKPQVKRFIPESFVPPYTPPTLEVSSGSGFTITGLSVDSLANMTGVIQSVNKVVSISSGNVFVFQFGIANSTNPPQYSVGFGDYSSSTPFRAKIFIEFTDVGGLNYVQLRTRDTNNSNTVISPQIVNSARQGTMVVNSNTREVLFYNSTGSLVQGLTSNATSMNDGLRKLTCFTPSISSTGKVVEFWTDKTTFPFDITLGALGVYLAANPNWKQVVEV